MNVVTIVGARPNFIKAALVSLELKRNGVDEFMVHTGQHYDAGLSSQIFNDLKIKLPDLNLNVGSGSHAEQTGKMLIEIEKVLLVQKPDAVVVYGDTNSTLAGALAGVKLKIPIVHIEAGERSFDKSMPEEINRIICDHIAKVNCCATKDAVINLKNEGIKEGVFWTGDVMLDLIKKMANAAKQPIDKIPSRFILFTLHRAENTDNRIRLTKTISALAKIDFSIVWPMHPRTGKMMAKFNINFPNNIIVIPPVSYTEMLWLISHSYRVATDSGGIQKESYWLGTPCVTLLKKTPWPQTLKSGWNQEVWDGIELLSEKLFLKPRGKSNVRQFGEGDAAKKIFQSILYVKQ